MSTKPKGIAPLPAEAVPIGDGKAQMLVHPLAQNNLFRIVGAEGRAFGVGGEAHRRNVFEISAHVCAPPLPWGGRLSLR